MTTNRITPYEAGWLTLLVQQKICTEQQARETYYRVAREAIEELDRRRAERRARRRLKKRRQRGDENPTGE